MALTTQPLTITNPKAKVLLDNIVFYPIAKQFLNKQIKIVDYKVPLSIDVTTNTISLYPFTTVVNGRTYYFGDLENAGTTAIFSYTLPDTNLYYVGLTYDSTNNVYNIVVTSDVSEIDYTLGIVKNKTIVYSLFDKKSTEPESPAFIIPAYIHPTDPSFEYLIDECKKLNTKSIFIVNPNNGPGLSIDENYLDIISRLKSYDKFVVFGYVYTSYGERLESDVKADIDLWMKMYPMIDGIFFDEVSNLSSYVSYYDALTEYAKSYDLYTIGNFGIIPDETYIKTNIFDINLVYEDSTVDYNTLKTVYTSALFDKKESAAVIHSQYNETKTNVILSNKVLLPASSLKGSINDIIVPGTLSISVSVGGTTYTITDDGNGSLIESTIVNNGSIDYITGEYSVTFNTGYVLDVGSSITASYNQPDYNKAFNIYQDLKDIFGYLYVTHDGIDGNPYDTPSVYLSYLNSKDIGKLDITPDIKVSSKYSLPGDTISFTIEPQNVDINNPRYVYSVSVNGSVYIDETYNPNVTYQVPSTDAPGTEYTFKVTVTDILTGSVYTVEKTFIVSDVRVDNITTTDNTFPVDTDITLTVSATLLDTTDTIVDYIWEFEDGSTFNGQSIVVNFPSDKYNNGDIVTVNVYAVTNKGFISPPYEYTITITKITSTAIDVITDTTLITSTSTYWTYENSTIFKLSDISSAISFMSTNTSMGYLVSLENIDYTSSTINFYVDSNYGECCNYDGNIRLIGIGTQSNYCYVNIDTNSVGSLSGMNKNSYLSIFSNDTYIILTNQNMPPNSNTLILYKATFTLYDAFYVLDSDGTTNHRYNAFLDSVSNKLLVTSITNNDVFIYDLQTKTYTGYAGLETKYGYYMTTVSNNPLVIANYYSDYANGIFYVRIYKGDLSTPSVNAIIDVQNARYASIPTSCYDATNNVLYMFLSDGTNKGLCIIDLTNNTLKMWSITNTNGTQLDGVSMGYDATNNILMIQLIDNENGRLVQVNIMDPLNSIPPMSSSYVTINDITASTTLSLSTPTITSIFDPNTPATASIQKYDLTTISLTTTDLTTAGITLQTYNYTPIVEPLA